VHNRCGDGFWIELAEELTGHFRQAQFSQGIIHAVRKAGDLLAQHFPRKSDDRNELPDTVVGD
jgi:uncharacterized membrane protein